MIKSNTFMDIAFVVSKESYCKKRQVGAIIVKNNNIIALGYNGTPSGFENVCEESRDIAHPDLGVVDVEQKTIPEVLHAESNAISKCAKSTSSSEGAEIYTTTAPCLECAKLIIQAGIRDVYYYEEYKNDEGLELLRKAKIHVERVIPTFMQPLRILPSNMSPDDIEKFKEAWMEQSEKQNDYTVESPEGFRQYYPYYRHSSFDDAIKRGWIWIDKEYFTGTILNSTIAISKSKKQVRSDKNDLFLSTHHITKEAVIEKLNPVLLKAKEKFEICKDRLLKLQKELDCNVDYTMYGDTHGIYEDYLHISFTIDGIFCKFEFND